MLNSEKFCEILNIFDSDDKGSTFINKLGCDLKKVKLLDLAAFAICFAFYQIIDLSILEEGGAMDPI